MLEVAWFQSDARYSPVQFDGAAAQPMRAPEHGEHTEGTLLALGIESDEIIRLKDSGAIGCPSQCDDDHALSRNYV